MGNLPDDFANFIAYQSGTNRGMMSFRNIPYQITITKEEAFQGCIKKDILRHLAKCETCDGTGDKDRTEIQFCKACDGTGSISKLKRFLFVLKSVSTKKCKLCNGTGLIVRNPCNTCSGSGKIEMPIEIHIPAGIKDNEMIALNLPDEDVKISVLVR